MTQMIVVHAWNENIAHVENMVDLSVFGSKKKTWRNNKAKGPFLRNDEKAMGPLVRNDGVFCLRGITVHVFIGFQRVFR